MILEYLVLNKEALSRIESIHANGVETNVYTGPDHRYWKVTFSILEEQDDDIKLLSDIDASIRKDYKSDIQVLTNGCSEHFTDALYPRVVQLERKLRKVLYMVSAVSDDDNAKNIHDLDKKTLYEVFELLFVDRSFDKKIKSIVNDKSDREQTIKFKSKKNTLRAIDLTEENTLWSALFDDDRCLSLRDNYETILDYRNDVMHSHFMTWDDYINAKELLTQACAELDSTINYAESITRESAKKKNSSINTSIQQQAAYAAANAKMLKQAVLIANTYGPILSHIQNLQNSENMLSRSFRPFSADIFDSTDEDSDEFSETSDEQE